MISALGLARIYVAIKRGVTTPPEEEDLKLITTLHKYDERILKNAAKLAREILKADCWRCRSCDDVFPTSWESVETSDGYDICYDCYHDHHFTCDYCNEVFCDDDSCTVGSETWCEGCADDNARYCDECERYYQEDEVRHVEQHDTNVCDGCFDRYYETCEECGTIYNHRTERRCPECGTCRNGEGNSRGLNDYTYKPAPVFYRSPNDKGKQPFLGIELEINAPATMRLDALAKDITNGRPWLYCKRDGSIGHGVEICLHPHTYNAIKDKKNEINNLLTWLRSKGCTSYKLGLCGLHIHVGKEELSGLSLYKLCRLVYENPCHWQRLSRRDSENLSRWAKVYLGLRPSQIKKMAVNAGKKRSSCLERYVALNLEPRKTVEFRLFRGTLDEDTLWGVIEIVHCAVSFCASSNSINSITPKGLWSWMRQQRKERKPQYPLAIKLWERRVATMRPEDTEVASQCA